MSGRSILLTRPEGRSAELCSELERLGARVAARPTIAFEAPHDQTTPTRALQQLGDYAWVVFTSPTGVRCFDELGRRRLGRRPAGAVRIAAVGPATAGALRAAGYVVDLVSSEHHGEGLASELRRFVRPGDRVLLVRPDVARDALTPGLAVAGVRVDAVPFYRTVEAHGAADVARDLLVGHYDAVVFTSPSTLARLREAAAREAVDVDAALRRVAVVVIGTVTAAAVREAGLPVAAAAERPTTAAIARALCTALAR